MTKKKALLVVDVQNDFISGSLALSKFSKTQDGAEVVPVVNRLVRSKFFDLIIFTQDWHPTNHLSFVDNVKLRKLHSSSSSEIQVFKSVTFDINGAPREQTLWPRHCVQDSDGAKLHSDLFVPDDAIRIRKGENPDVDSYSAFWDNSKLKATPLEGKLRERGIEFVYVCGIATDVCVKATVYDALDLGFKCFLIKDACRGVNEKEIESILREMDKKGIKLISSTDIVS